MRFTDSDLDALKQLLETWFHSNLTRQSIGTFDPNLVSPSVAQVAARIYKRGLAGLRDTSGRDHSLMSLPPQSLVPPLSILTPDDMKLALENIPENTFFVIDGNLANLWPEWGDLASQRPAQCHVIFPSEDIKTLDTAFNIYDKIVGRFTGVLGVGGGITTDIAGFVAGLANCKVSYVSTTLLSGVDASIGGKTGVNHPPYGKNQLGIFVSAESLTLVPGYFSTLSDLDILCGLAESFKHAWIAGTFETQRDLLVRILKAKAKAQESDFRALVSINSAFKAQIVNLDPLEKGLRKVLNLGHTLGHCIEGLSEAQLIEPVPHGMAVALGLQLLMDKKQLGQVPPGAAAFLSQLLAEGGFALPLNVKAPIHTVVEQAFLLLGHDKKNTSDVQKTAKPSGVAFVLCPYRALQENAGEIHCDYSLKFMTLDFIEREFFHTLFDYT